MSIRPAVAADYEALERLWSQQNERHVALHPTHVRRVSEGYLSPEQYAEAILGPAREIAVLEERGTIIGAVIIRTRVMDGKYTVPRTVAHVNEIIVEAPHRGRGLGRALLDYVEAWARERALQAVELNVWANNAEAMAFYDTLGFSTLRYELHKRIDR